MNTSTWRTGIFCFMALALMAGCQTYPNAGGLSPTPVVPAANEQIIRDQLIIIVDETGSIGATRKFEYEKALVQAFTAAMPDGDYESGIDSFAGVSSKEWLEQPLAPFSREVMTRAASDLKPLGSLTPLARAIHSQTAELSGRGGRGALLIFSDGKVRIPQEVLDACREIKVSHGGELCIYTVQVGDSDRGRKLLQEMASANGCGKYYDGELLNSSAAIDALVRDIFLGAREAPMPAPITQKPAPAMAWTINNILFDNDKSVIAPKYNSLLDEAAGILKDNPAKRLRLEGNTDSNASDQYNQKLSERRVNAVKAALTSRGINAERLEINAYGEGRPAVPNTSPDNMHKNRRVELSVID